MTYACRRWFTPQSLFENTTGCLGLGVDPKDIIPMRAFAGQSEQQPLHFAVIFGRSMMSCLGMFYGRYVWLLHIHFQYTNQGCRKSCLLSILNTFEKGHQQQDLIIDSRFISLNQWPEWLNFWVIAYIKRYFRRKHKFTPLKFWHGYWTYPSFHPELSTFSIKDQGPSFFVSIRQCSSGVSSFHYRTPLHGWVSYLQ